MIQVAAYSDVGGRSNNEDAMHWQHEGGALCAVVADGLGGHGYGEVASALAVEAVCDNWHGEVSAASMEHLIRTAHQAVREKQGPRCDMRTTVVALELRKGKMAWSYAGDSRLYHFFNGQLLFQTRDHSASQIAVALGDITTAQIRFHQDRNKVFRTLGQEDNLPIDAKELELPQGSHAWLLCSDGFWEYVLEEEMEEDLAASANPQQWIEKMRERLRKRIPADNDNNTALAVWMND